MAHGVVGRAAHAHHQGDETADHEERRREQQEPEDVEHRAERLDTDRVRDVGESRIREVPRVEPDGDEDDRETDAAEPREPTPPRRGQMAVGEQQQQVPRDRDEGDPAGAAQRERERAEGQVVCEGVGPVGGQRTEDRAADTHRDHQPGEAGFGPPAEHEEAHRRERQEQEGEDCFVAAPRRDLQRDRQCGADDHDRESELGEAPPPTLVEPHRSAPVTETACADPSSSRETCRTGSPAIGITPRIVVPLPGALSTAIEPSSAPSRSAMPWSPVP